MFTIHCDFNGSFVLFSSVSLQY